MSHLADVISILREERKTIRHCPQIQVIGNKKLMKDSIASFSIPAGISCPDAGTCNGGFCYAQTGRFSMNNTIRSHVKNYLASQKNYFVDVMIDRIFRLKRVELIRIHVAGDFYSQAYVNKWTQIISNCPEMKFYAYTKSFVSLDLEALWNLENIHIIQSTGSRDDSKINYLKPHARIFKNEIELVEAGYIDCSNSDLIAAQGVKLVGLIARPNTLKKFGS